jgi:hypothetical protein
MSEAVATRLSDLWKGTQLPPFQPSCHYIKELDWLIYLARDCSYVATPTKEPQIEHLKDGEETVGIKILGFSQLPRGIRRQILESTNIDPDDIKGIEDIWIQNFERMAPAFFASQKAFFEELRRRDNLWRHNALYDPTYPSVGVRHAHVMAHLQSLDPVRLP